MPKNRGKTCYLSLLATDDRKISISKRRHGACIVGVFKANTYHFPRFKANTYHFIPKSRDRAGHNCKTLSRDTNDKWPLPKTPLLTEYHKYHAEFINFKEISNFLPSINESVWRYILFELSLSAIPHLTNLKMVHHKLISYLCFTTRGKTMIK